MDHSAPLDFRAGNDVEPRGEFRGGEHAGPGIDRGYSGDHSVLWDCVIVAMSKSPAVDSQEACEGELAAKY